MILGITNDYPVGVLWQFVPASQTFPDPQHPWPFNTNLSYTALNASQAGQNFIAIKLGDLLDAWTLPAGGIADLGAELRTKVSAKGLMNSGAPGISFAVGTTTASPNGMATVPLQVSGFSLATTAQFTLAWDTNQLAFVSTGGYGLPNLDASNFGTNFTTLGKLTFSWDDPSLNGVTVTDDAPIFTIQFQVLRANTAGATVSFADNPTARETSIDFSEVPFLAQNGTVQFSVQVPPRIGPARLSGTVFTVSVATIPGRSHVLEFKNTMTDSAWTPLQTLLGTGDVVTFTDDAATGLTRYYRIRVE